MNTNNKINIASNEIPQQYYPNKINRPLSRKNIRARIQGEVILHNDSYVVKGNLVNLSVGGCFIDTKGGQLYEHIKVIIKLESYAPIHISGQIVRQEDSSNSLRIGTAIQFNSIDEGDKKIIQTIVFEKRIEELLQVE